MGAKFLFSFVLTWLSCASVYTQSLRSCSDCVDFGSCTAAVTLYRKNDAASIAHLKNALCGYDDGNLPMMCCSELTKALTTTAASAPTIPPTTPAPRPTPPTTLPTPPRTSAPTSLPTPLRTPAPTSPSTPPSTPAATLLPTLPSTAGSVYDHPNLRLLPDKCGTIDGGKIIGGPPAGIYEYPWMVLISYRTRNGLDFQCGGSLINERYVLTAAHCIAGLTLAGVRVGEHDIASDRDCQGAPPTLTCEDRLQDLYIEEEIAHPAFGRIAQKNDIGLLRLKNPVNLTYKNAGTICLPVTRDLQSRNLSALYATVAGWGISDGQDAVRRPSAKLQAVEIPILSAEICRQWYNRRRLSNEEDSTINKICAGEEDKDSCEGDSGGPLMLKGAYRNAGERYIQHGVVSYGSRNCGIGRPAIYTDVAKYMKWILDNIRP